MGKKRRGDDLRRSDSEIKHKCLQNGSNSSRMNPEETPREASLENILQQMVQGLSMSTQILRQMQDKDYQFRKTEDKLVDIEAKFEKKVKEIEERYEKKFKEMEEELDKRKNECKVLKQEQEKFKDNAVARSSAYSSPAQRTQPDHSQQPRLNLKILSEMKDKSYKGKNIRTKTMDCVEVGLFDGDSPITHDHHLLSAKVKLVILKEEFYKDDQDYWSKEDFMKALKKTLKRHGDGTTPMRIENCTFNLTSGYARHRGAIILDNSNRKAVRLGVMIAGRCEERVLEGISNPFKVQEAKTDKTKPGEGGSTADNGQHQQVPRNNRSQPTSAQPTSENGEDEILAANGQQQQIPMNNRSQHTIARSASENGEDEILAANGQQQQVPMNNRSQHTISRSASENGNIFAANHQQQSYRPFDMNNWSLSTIARSAEHDNSNRKAVRLGVMIVGHQEERVLEGISNPFKVQEARTDPDKTEPEGDILSANRQQQQAPMNNRSQPTTAQSASENGEGQGLQSFPLDTEIKSVQPSLYQHIGNGDYRQNLQQNSMNVPLASTSHTAITHRDNLSPPPFTTGQGAAGCYQQSFQQNSMDTSHETAITHNGQDVADCYQQNFIGTSHDTAITHNGQGRQSFPLPEINSVQPSLYQLTGNGKILSGDSRQNLQPNSMSVPLASTSHTAVTHSDNLSPLPFTTGQGVGGCYQQSFQQNCMDTSHDTAITRNGHGESSQIQQDFSQLHNIYPPGNSSTRWGGNDIPIFRGFRTQSTSQKDRPFEYAGDSYPQTQNQVIPNLQPGNGGPIIFNRVQLPWDEPDVEPPRCWNILDKLMPLFPDKRLVHEYDRLLASDYFLKTMMRVHGTVGIANRSMQRHHNRGVLIQSIEDSDSEHGPPLKTKRQASYQLRFVNKACREYYIWEQIKSVERGLLKVALYNEDSLRITSGPLSSASVEIVLLHGDFNADGQDYWSPEEFGNYMLCPLSEEEPPALGGECVLTLVDGEASLSSASFQKISSFTRTGKFTMGVKMKTTLEERVQEGITQPFLVQSHQDEDHNQEGFDPGEEFADQCQEPVPFADQEYGEEYLDDDFGAPAN